jgi:glutathione S-transferase
MRRAAPSSTSSSSGSTRSGRKRRTRSRTSSRSGIRTRRRSPRSAPAGRGHLFGEFSAADCAAFPFLKFGQGRDPADHELFHRILEEHLKLDGSHPRLAAWIDRVDQRPRAY